MKALLLLPLFCLGFLPLKSQKSENLSKTAKANIEALERANDPVPYECRGCGSNYAGSYCCTAWINGKFIYLYHDIDDSQDPIWE